MGKSTNKLRKPGKKWLKEAALMLNESIQMYSTDLSIANKRDGLERVRNWMWQEAGEESW